MEYALHCNANVHMMIQRRAKAAGPHTKISFYSFRAAHTATHFQNGVKSEIAQQGMNPRVPPSFAMAERPQ
jgi:hypothetical protein